MVNKFLFIICCCSILTQACYLCSENLGAKPTVRWQTNYDEGLKEAKSTSKPLVLLFTGSDWCSWCTKLEDEALNSPEFAVQVGPRFILVKLDFPLYTNQDPQVKAQNKQLQQKFDVRSFPSVVIYDPQNDQLVGMATYRPGGGKQYAEYLLKLSNDYSSYKQKMSVLEKSSFTGTDLKRLYEQAHKLHLRKDASKIVSLGIKSDKPLFFLTERYRQLAQDGQIHKPEAMALRQQLLAADPDNDRLAPYHIAMIDFETYYEEIDEEDRSPELAIAPLSQYIQKYGAQDKENSWRLEMIISQVYLDNDQISEALKHAQLAYESAPTTAQPEIARAIQNIRSQMRGSSLITRSF